MPAGSMLAAGLRVFQAGLLWLARMMRAQLVIISSSHGSSTQFQKQHNHSKHFPRTKPYMSKIGRLRNGWSSQTHLGWLWQLSCRSVHSSLDTTKLIAWLGSVVRDGRWVFCWRIHQIRTFANNTMAHNQGRKKRWERNHWGEGSADARSLNFRA